MLEEFASDPEMDLSGHDPDLVSHEVKTIALGDGNWVSGCLIGSYPCYFIGGPEFTDGRVFGTLASALAAVAHKLGMKLARSAIETRRSGLAVIRPKQREIGGGCYIAGIARSTVSVLLTVGPRGPHGAVFDDWATADNACYTKASGV